MDTTAEVQLLCRMAQEKQTEWRTKGGEERLAAYDLYRMCLERIALDTSRTYEDVFCEAVEEWVTEHACMLGHQAQLGL